MKLWWSLSILIVLLIAGMVKLSLFTPEDGKTLDSSGPNRNEVRLPSGVARTLQLVPEPNALRNTTSYQDGDLPKAFPNANIDLLGLSEQEILTTVCGGNHNFSRLADFEFSPSEIRVAKELTVEFANAFAQIYMNNVNEDYLSHDPSNGVFAYRSSPFVEGPVELQRFSSKIVEAFGANQARIFFDNMINDDSFGRFGTLDVAIKFADANDSGNLQWIYYASDPETGDSLDMTYSDHAFLSMMYVGPLCHFVDEKAKLSPQ